MSGICDTCKRDECYIHTANWECTLYMKGKTSNYKKLFGTPERAARTLYYDKEPICAGCALLDECDKIPDEAQDICLLIDHDKLLEWLEGDAE